MKEYQSKNIAPKSGEGILTKAKAVTAQASNKLFSSLTSAMVANEQQNQKSQAKSQAMQDVANGELKDYDKDNWFKTKYGEVYDSTALTLAEKQYTENIQSVVKKAHAGNIGNPTSFRKSADMALNALEPKDPRLKAMFQSKRNKMLEVENLAVTKEFMKKSSKEKMEALKYVRTKLSYDFLDAKNSGDKTKTLSVENEMKKRLVDNGYTGDLLDEEMYNFKLESYTNEAIKNVNAVVDGNIDISKLQKDILALDIHDVDKTELFNSISERYNAIKKMERENQKDTQNKIKVSQSVNFNNLIKGAVGGSIKKDNIVKALDDGDISYKQYKDINKAISADNVDLVDESILMQAIAYPSTINIDAIMSTDRISTDTKIKILNKVRSMPKWTAGINYKQGVAEIYSKFNVDMNGLVVIEKGSDIKALGKVTSAYHDIMSKIPADKKEELAKEVSRKVLKRYMQLSSEELAGTKFRETVNILGEEIIKNNPSSIKINDFMRDY